MFPCIFKTQLHLTLPYDTNMPNLISSCCLVAKTCPIPYDPHGLEPARFVCPVAFFRHEYWGGLPFPSPGDLPDPGIKLTSSGTIFPIIGKFHELMHPYSCSQKWLPCMRTRIYQTTRCSSDNDACPTEAVLCLERPFELVGFSF